MPSFTTTYTCPSCNKTFRVEIAGLSDPEGNIAPRTQDNLRMIQAVRNRLGETNESDPVAELSQQILEQEAHLELRYATCPSCGEKNPAGIADDTAVRRQSLRFGIIFFGALAIAARYVSWVALFLPLMDLFVFRPIMVVQTRKANQPLKLLPFSLGIALDVALIALIILVPQAAPLVPIAGIVQSLVRRPTKNDGRWDEAAKKFRFEV